MLVVYTCLPCVQKLKCACHEECYEHWAMRFPYSLLTSKLPHALSLRMDGLDFSSYWKQSSCHPSMQWLILHVLQVAWLRNSLASEEDECCLAWKMCHKIRSQHEAEH